MDEALFSSRVFEVEFVSIGASMQVPCVFVSLHNQLAKKEGNIAGVVQESGGFAW